MTDINSIIEMIEQIKPSKDWVELDSYQKTYNEACDDIIEQLRKMSEWEPMEIAPKDGTEILLCSAVIHDIGLCYWRDDKSFTGWTWGMNQKFNYPIGWQHLPKPPNSKEL